MKAKTAFILVLLAALAAACKSRSDEPSPTNEGTTAPSTPAPDPAESAPPPKTEGGANSADTAHDIHSSEVSYKVGETTLKGYLAYDKTAEGVRPGVLVVHEWWGHNDYARMRARMLAQLGYTALAVDMYGDGKQAAHPDDAKKFMMEVMSNMEAGAARFEAAKKLLEEHETTDPTKTAAIGYCFGGGVVLHMARSGMDLDAVASFHGSLSTKSPAKKGEVKSRILVLHGAADPFVPNEQVAAFKKEMTDAGADVSFHQYEGAKHAFTNPGASALGKKFELPLEYDEEADKKSWAELEAFLAHTFNTGTGSPHPTP